MGSSAHQLYKVIRTHLEEMQQVGKGTTDSLLVERSDHHIKIIDTMWEHLRAIFFYQELSELLAKSGKIVEETARKWSYELGDYWSSETAVLISQHKYFGQTKAEYTEDYQLEKLKEAKEIMQSQSSVFGINFREE